MDFLVSASSMSRTGSLPLVLDFLHPEPVSPLQSFAKLDSVLPVLDFLRSGLPLLARASARTDFAPFVIGMGRLGFCFSLLVIDSTWLGFLLLTRSSGQPDSALLALDPLRLDLPLLLGA